MRLAAVYDPCLVQSARLPTRSPARSSMRSQTFIKLFTMMYGDFDVDFLTNIDSGALGLDELTQVLVSIYMIMVRRWKREPKEGPGTNGTGGGDAGRLRT